VTFSVASDGTITVNGTNPNSYAGIPYADLVTAKDLIYETRYTLPIGKYKITSTGNGLKFQVYCHDGTSVHSQLFSDKSDGEFEYTSALKTQYPYICWRLAIDANASFSNQIIKPMIWNAEIKDSTFVPYALPNPTLTPAAIKAVDEGAKNKLKNSAVTQTVGEVVYTVNSDGTVSVYTTATTTANRALTITSTADNCYVNAGDIITGTPNTSQDVVIQYGIGPSGNIANHTPSEEYHVIAVSGYVRYCSISIRSGVSIPQSSPLIFKPMICTASDWAVSQKFVPYALSNPIITPALVNQVDGGAKNKLHITQIGSSDSNVGTKITSQGVEYEIQSDGTITAYRKTSSSSGAYIFLYENGSVKNVSEFFDGQHVWSGNPSQYPSTISVWYKVGSGSNVTMPNGTILPDVNGASVRIGFQINSSLSPSQSNPIVFKPMICSVSDWQVSQKFVPYCPTMRELYQMILALQNGGA
jgi:hypothetical protein